jgi:transposase-like protein
VAQVRLDTAQREDDLQQRRAAELTASGTKAMKCPVCGTYTEVIDSRMRSDGTRRRRYLCANMHRFTTLELILPEKK